MIVNYYLITDVYAFSRGGAGSGYDSSRRPDRRLSPPRRGGPTSAGGPGSRAVDRGDASVPSRQDRYPGGGAAPASRGTNLPS